MTAFTFAVDPAKNTSRCTHAVSAPKTTALQLEITVGVGPFFKNFSADADHGEATKKSRATRHREKWERRGADRAAGPKGHATVAGSRGHAKVSTPN